MSALALRFDVVAEEVAAEHGALTVDTNDPQHLVRRLRLPAERAEDLDGHGVGDR